MTKSKIVFLNTQILFILLLSFFLNPSIVFAQIAELIHTFEGHTDSVKSVAFSPDGKTALSGSSDNTIKLWDVETGQEITTLTGHSDKVYAVSFFTDNNTIISASGDQTIKLWDITTGEQIMTLNGHEGAVRAIALSPDKKTIVSGSEDNTIKLWNINTKQEIMTFQGHKQPIYSVAYSPDGRFIVSGSFDHTLKLWDSETGEEIRSFEEHTGNVDSVTFSPDGTTVLSASADNSIRLWDAETGEVLNKFRHADRVYTVAYFPNGQYALSGSQDNKLKLWEIATGKLLETFKDHSDWIYAVTFSSDGLYALSGSKDKTMKLWKMLFSLNARFTMSRTATTAPVTVTLDASDSFSQHDITNYQWSISNGETMTGKQVEVTFQENGTYTITLTIEDSDNQTATIEKKIVFQENVSNEPPQAAFTLSQSQGVAPLTVNVDASTSLDSDGTIENYQWASDDGQTAEGQQAEMTFQNTGDYTITLTVTDNNEAIATAQKTVNVNNNDTSNEPPQVAFTLSPSQGVAPLTVNLEASASFDPDGTIENYQWTSDDGQTAEGQQAEMTFENSGNYTITLTVTDNDEATATAQKTINVNNNDIPSNEPPQAAFTVSPNQGLAPLTVNLEASASIDPDGTIENYQWSSDDGQTAEGQQAKMTFQNIGDYTITLTVTDDNEATATAQKTINVNDNTPPEAKFTVSPTEGQKPLTLRLDGSQSDDPNGTIVNWKWQSSGGKTLEGEKTNFVLTDVGEQTITLTVTDNEGAITIAEQTVTVFGEAPMAKFKATPLTGKAPLTVQLDSSNSYDSDGKIINYAWEISDGQNSSGRNPSILFENAGSYEISLIITDNDGLQSKTVTKTITVEESDVVESSNPIAQLRIEPLSGVAPLTITLEGSESVDPDGGSLILYEWVATNDETTLTATGETATLTFDKAGDYTLTLTVTNESGKTSSTTETITVSEFSEIAFEGLKKSYDVGEAVDINVVEILPKNTLEKVDLWIAIQMPTGELLFLTLEPQFSFAFKPTPFKRSIDNSETTHQILNEFEIMSGIGGDYTFYALYVMEGENPLENLDNLETIQRSHLLIKSTVLANE